MKPVFGQFVKRAGKRSLAYAPYYDEGDRELGYRFRVEYWGKGYGTEVTKGLIDFCFQDLKIEKITADVNVENIASTKILNKFLKPVREFFNEKDNCTDRRYELYS